MNDTPLSDVVSSQYTKWVYPEPIVDLPAWLQNNWQWFDPSHAHRIFWPAELVRHDLDILVAGCGTNQAAVIAFNNPKDRVTAVDVSRESLAHHQFLKDQYRLNNLELRLLPIEQINTLDRTFDLIISTGVLHHLASPEAGIKALAQCLRPKGVMALMLYAKYGRLGVDMLQSVFRDMGFGQNDKAVQMIKDALASLPQDHPVKSYMAIAPDLGYEAGLVDTFLHGRERNYSIDECQAFVASAGLVFQDLYFKAPYHPPAFSSNPFHKAVSLLAKERQWAIMEQINFRNGCHFFTACRAEGPTAHYKIDFTDDSASAYKPFLRHRCRLEGQQLHRHDWSMNLDENQQSLVSLVDGQRSIQEIAQLLQASGKKQWEESVSTLNFATFQFGMFFRLDLMAFSL